MTANQISYQRHLEEKRHNLAQEEIGRGQVSAAFYGAQAQHASVAEARRHNTAQEGINWYTAYDQEVLHRDQGAAALSQAASAAKRAETGQYSAETQRAQVVTGFILGRESNQIASDRLTIDTLTKALTTGANAIIARGGFVLG